MSFCDSPRSAFRNLDCFRAFCDEECYWCLVVLEYRPFFLQQPKYLFMNLLPQQRNGKILYIYLKKEEEGVSGVPIPQLRDSINELIFSAVFSCS